MATSTAAQQRALMFLETVRLMAEDLPQVADEWEGLQPAERASWSLDWAQAMTSQLTALAEAHARGELTAEQSERYCRLLTQLRSALPLVDRLGLYRPPVPLDADGEPPVRSRPPEADRAR